MNDTITIFTDRAERFSHLLAHAEGRWDAPTPCTDWTVSDLVRHVIDTERDFLDRQQLSLPTPPESADPAQAWQTHAQAVIDVLSHDSIADRSFDGYFGPTTIGDTMANFYGWDLAVHAWDLARATGQGDPISEAEARELSTVADGWGPSLYSAGICAPARPIDDDASDVAKLLAKLGRDPGWSAA
ncbi:MAG: TIGR03086 family metal-binding protein [Micropruina sp.]|uniref:TIGR03086 family metal-binding protein n=1 Tax=Micropruina sp. TaxID=2737536 RepID=UPI0039E4EA01